MTRHVDARILRAFDHHELSADREHSVSRHLEDCDACRKRLATIRAIREAAAYETTPEPSDLWPGILERVQQEDPVLLPVTDDREVRDRRSGRRSPGPADDGDRRGRLTSPGVRKRAVVVAFLLLAVSVAGVVGASVGPLDDWIRDVLKREVPVSEGLPGRPPLRGVEVPVADAGLVVELREPDPDLIVRVETAAGDLAAINLEGAEVMGRFVSGRDRITVVAAADGVLEVRVPDGAAPLRIAVDGSTILEVSGGRVGPPGDVTLRRVEGRLGDLVGS